MGTVSLKQLKRIFLAGSTVIFTFSLFVFFVFAETSDPPDDPSTKALQEKLQIKNQEIANLEKEIATYKKELENTSKEANSLGNTIKSIDSTRKNLSTNISLSQKKIDATFLEIESLEKNITLKSKNIETQYRGLGETLRRIRELDEISFSEAILGTEDLGDTWNNLIQIEEAQGEMQNAIGKLLTLKEKLSKDKATKEGKNKDLKVYKTRLGDQKNIADMERREKDALLKETKNKESNYKKLVAEREAKREAFQSEILDIESKLQLIKDPSQIPKGSRGLFSSPLDEMTVTQVFGHTDFASSRPKLYSAGIGHNGVDFKASVGTPIKAVADGVVTGTGNTDTVCYKASYGKWILIRHDGRLSTLSAHLSLISVNAGDTITRGQVIGYSGNTGYATGPHLHFTTMATDGVQITTKKSTVCKGTYTMPIADLRAYLDPMLFL